MTSIRLILAACHPLLGRGIARALGRDPSLELVASVDSLSNAVALTSRLAPDLLLVDSSACEANAAAQIEAIRARRPDTRVVLLTEPGGDDMDDRLPKLVTATLLRSIEPSALLKALHRIASGDVADDTAVQDQLAASLPQLTKREREVLTGLSQGFTNRQIARRLWLSEHTVKFHVSSIYRKLGVRTRAEAASMLLDGGTRRPEETRADQSTQPGHPAVQMVGDLLSRRPDPTRPDIRKSR